MDARHVLPRAVFLSLLFTAGCKSGERGGLGNTVVPTDAGGDADSGSSISCRGSYRCDGDVAVSCATGARVDCSRNGQGCIDRHGCSECSPGARSCADGVATLCRDDGRLAHYECDPVQGMTCTASGCLGECDLSAVQDSYIGCDYYPTVTLNPVWSGFSFAVAVSNTSTSPTRVTITRGSEVVREQVVAASALQTFELPWVADLKGGDITCTQPPARGDSRVVASGAYRVRSDRPVTVYQFSPLEYQIDAAPLCPTMKPQCADSEVTSCFSYSNDASLLLPATALTGSYTVLAWPAQKDGSGFIAVTATEDRTRVDVHGVGAFAAGAGIAAEGTSSVMLDRGGVLELVSATTSDISGTRIRADKPVQVLSGHSCAYVPTETVPNCDHLEEVVLPEETLASEYVVPRQVYLDGATPIPSIVRIAAIQADTHVHLDPVMVGDTTLAAGTYLELALTEDVHVTSDKPISITTYMEGQAALQQPVGTSFPLGDPSMSTAVPVEQYRDNYLFTAPSSYAVNLATIVAKRGTAVRVDGRLLSASELTAVGASDYSVGHVILQNDPAVHTVSADSEVGLTVYGFGEFTSYMYPGGADLERITVPILL